MVCREVRNGKAKLVLIWENSFVYATVEKIERLRYDVVCVVMGVEVRKLGCFSGLPAIEAQHWAGCRAASRNGRARTKTLKRRPGVRGPGSQGTYPLEVSTLPPSGYPRL